MTCSLHFGDQFGAQTASEVAMGPTFRQLYSHLSITVQRNSKQLELSVTPRDGSEA